MGAASSSPVKRLSSPPAPPIVRLEIAPFLINPLPEFPLVQIRQFEIERYSRSVLSIIAEFNRTRQQKLPVNRAVNAHLPQANMWLSIFESLKIPELVFLMLTCKHLLHASNANPVRERLHNARQAKFHTFFPPPQNELRLPPGFPGIQLLPDDLDILPNSHDQAVNPGPQGFVMNL